MADSVEERLIQPKELDEKQREVELDDLSFWLNELKYTDPAGAEFRNITSLTKELLEEKKLNQQKEVDEKRLIQQKELEEKAQKTEMVKEERRLEVDEEKLTQQKELEEKRLKLEEEKLKLEEKKLKLEEEKLIQQKELEKKTRRNELIKAGIMTGAPVVTYTCLYVIGLNFEKTGFITSNMVKDLIRRFKS